MAARMRTSTDRGRELPTGVSAPSCRVRRSFTCITGLMSPISSRNSVPPSALSKRPATVGHRPGEGSLDVPEHLALDQLRRHRRAVQLHEGLVPPGGVGVDRPRHELLPGSPLTADEDPGPGGRHHVDQLVDALHGVGAPHHPVAVAVEGAPAPASSIAGSGRQRPLAAPPRAGPRATGFSRNSAAPRRMASTASETLASGPRSRSPG